MQKFSQIELFLDGTYSKQEQTRFIFMSRCICNYIERGLVELGFETELARVNIKCSREDKKKEPTVLKGAPFLEVNIQYSVPDFSELSVDEIQKCYTDIVLQGLKSASGFMPVPIEYCMNRLKDFESIGYINKWVHARKAWSEAECIIEAEVTIHEFILSLILYVGGEFKKREILIKTKPREMLFLSYFGKLSFDEKKRIFIYKNSKGKIISQINPLEDLS